MATSYLRVVAMRAADRVARGLLDAAGSAERRILVIIKDDDTMIRCAGGWPIVRKSTRSTRLA